MIDGDARFLRIWLTSEFWAYVAETTKDAVVD